MITANMKVGMPVDQPLKRFRPTLLGLFAMVWIGLFCLTLAIAPVSHEQIEKNLLLLKQVDAVVNTNILKARFGLDAHYDPLIQHWQQYQSTLKDLEFDFSASRLNVALQTKLTDLQQKTQNKDQLIERFKSQNAVLQNSLRYLPTAVNQLMSQVSVDNPIALQFEQLLQDILVYNLNAREELRSKIAEEIQKLEAIQSQQNAAIALALENITVHSEAILRLKPEVAKLITDLMLLPSANSIDALTIAYDAEYYRRLEQINVERLMLYGVAIAIFAYTIALHRNRQKAKRLESINQLLEKEVSDRTQVLQETLVNLQQSQTQLIQAEKMSGLGQMVAGIAHEVNNPINFIYANISPAQMYANDLLQLFQLYAQHYPIPVDDIKAYQEEIDLEFLAKDLPNLMNSMKVGAQRIRDLVLSLRNFSRLDESEFKAIDLHEGLESTLLILQHRLTPHANCPNIKVIKEYDDLPLVDCYASLLNQVFMNLIANAIDALEEEGTTGSTATIQIRTRRSDEDHVTICIADNGMGIPESVQQKLFDPFFTTKPVGKGTGLGLSIAYQIIVEKHRGKLWCQSTEGKGTEFWIELPVQCEEN
jgi:signal transduction histidine kinase